MKKFINRVEKGMIRVIIFSLVIMVVVQTMMTREDFRLFLSWGEKLEGQPINYPVSSAKQAEHESASKAESPQALMTLSMDNFASLPKVDVLVNGKKAGTFTDKQVSLQLAAGDVVEIDSRCYDFPITYRINNTSDNVASPTQGSIFTANQSIIMVGKIIVK